MLTLSAPRACLTCGTYTARLVHPQVTAMSNSSAPANPSDDLDQRRREQVDALLAQAPARSDGSVVLDSGRMTYTTVAEFLPVRASGSDELRGDPQAAVFTTAYLAQGVPARPVCFAFNGGPGSASLWLHLGALGPKRIVVPDDGSMAKAPYAVSDNPLSWLAHFDLVFIDPPHTGWSLSANKAARKTLLSVDGDVDALTDVMLGWLSRHRRWGSQVYLAGESYGTTRGAALADRLQDAGVALSGLILVSCAMDLQSIAFAPRNDLPYALFLPAFANVAQYHGRLKGTLAASSEAARAAAEEFAATDYLIALHAGSKLSDDKRRRTARRVAELTGLSADLVEHKNLRISDRCYFVELLRAQGRIVGRLEARVSGPMAANRSNDWEFDPGMEAITAPYTMAALAYFSEALGVQSTQRYERLARDVHREWDWSRRAGDAPAMRGNGFASTSDDLSRALRRNSQLRVFAASGRYDLGTPYSASDWSLAQLDINDEVRTRVEHHYYDAGHMMYTREADLRKLKTDLATWLAA